MEAAYDPQSKTPTKYYTPKSPSKALTKYYTPKSPSSSTPVKVDESTISDPTSLELLSPGYESSALIERHPLSYYGVKIKDLGKGSYGSVALYEGGASGTSKVAIKKIVNIDPKEGIRPNTLREIALMVRTNHPNIVPLLDVIKFEPHLNSVSIVLPVANRDLRGELDSNPPKYIRKSIAYQILCAFSYLASRDIMHRDLKPQNILVYDQENFYPLIQITDFGLSRPAGCIYSKGFTKMVYTRWYRPPELLPYDADGYDVSADVWSIGCTLYELYTGKALFPGNSEDAVAKRIFKLLGTPTAEDLISLHSQELKDWAHKYQFIGEEEALKVEINDESMSEMILACLTYNPTRRPSAYSLAINAYFDNVRVPKNEFPLQSCKEAFKEREWYPANGMPKQKYIKERMVHIVMDWLIAVWNSFKLTPRSFYIGQFLLDWAISKLSIEVNRLQLLGCTCHFIAAKFCEVYAPSIADYVYIADNSFTAEDMRSLEQQLLDIFAFDLVFSVSVDFLALDSESAPFYATMALMAITFMPFRFQYLPSEQAEIAMEIGENRITDKWRSHILEMKSFFSKNGTKFPAIEKYSIKKGTSQNLASFYTYLRNLKV